jgi:hypothetical protein
VEVRLVEALEAGTLPDDLLICGAAGTGKTYSVLLVLHLLAADHPDLRILVARATRASLTESALVTYEQEILPRDGMEGLAAGVKRRVRQGYIYPNGSEIVLGGLDNPTRILSTAWDFVYINEAIEANEETWETIRSRLARPGRDSAFGYLIGDTNPGHPDHWLKRRCDTGLTTMWDTAHEANPAMHDGRAWTAAGAAYLRQLDALTGTRRARLRDGLWAVGDGLWFDGFDPAIHVTEDAAFDPAATSYLSVDPGVFTGAVLFQQAGDRITVVADYLSENKSAEQNAEALNRLIAEHVGSVQVAYCDPAGGARNPIGPTVMDIYRRHGLLLRPWARANPSVSDSLENVAERLNPPGGVPLLTIHPRCKSLINAFLSYRRAKRNEQWADYPADPQHPAEDVIDSLRGGLFARFPGRRTLRITPLASVS